MRCNHTRKPFTIRLDAGPNPCLFVLRDQIDEVKRVLIDRRFIFAADPANVYADGKQFRFIYFRPDLDVAALEVALAKA